LSFGELGFLYCKSQSAEFGKHDSLVGLGCLCLLDWERPVSRDKPNGRLYGNDGNAWATKPKRLELGGFAVCILGVRE
jgi:hypothetical protein